MPKYLFTFQKFRQNLFPREKVIRRRSKEKIVKEIEVPLPLILFHLKSPFSNEKYFSRVKAIKMRRFD